MGYSYTLVAKSEIFPARHMGAEMPYGVHKLSPDQTKRMMIDRTRSCI